MNLREHRKDWISFDREGHFTRGGRGEETPKALINLPMDGVAGGNKCVTTSSLLKELKATGNRSHIK